MQAFIRTIPIQKQKTPDELAIEQQKQFERNIDNRQNNSTK